MRIIDFIIKLGIINVTAKLTCCYINWAIPKNSPFLRPSEICFFVDLPIFGLGVLFFGIRRYQPTTFIFIFFNRVNHRLRISDIVVKNLRFSSAK